MGLFSRTARIKTFLKNILWYKIESVMFTLSGYDVVDIVAGVITCPFEIKVRVPIAYMI